MTDLGCFRCHDDKHVSAEGKVISKDCNSCHTIMYQGTGPRPEVLSATGLEFRHPEDIGDAWRETHCRDCHTGG
jgi:cytochrome c peroxidase